MGRRPAVPGLDRRQDILEAALDVFAEQGYEGATTKDIASRADVTHGLIYFYFPSKEDLFREACSHQAAVVYSQLDIQPDGAETQPEQAIREIVRRFIHATTAPRSINLLRMMMRAGMHDSCGDPGEGGRVQLRALFREVARQFERYLERQIQLGRIRPVNAVLAAQFLYAALVSLNIRKMMGSEELSGTSLDEIAQSITDIFLHGVLPQPEQEQHEERSQPPAADVDPAR